jgi:hypothetical protein
MSVQGAIIRVLTQGLSEKFGGPGQIFVSGALFFPKMLAREGGCKKFFSGVSKKGQKNFLVEHQLRWLPRVLFPGVTFFVYM